MNRPRRAKKEFQIFNINIDLNYFLSLFFLLLTFYSFFLIIKFSNKTHDLLTKKNPELNKDVDYLNEKIFAIDALVKKKISNISTKAKDLNMHKANFDDKVIFEF